MRRFLSLLLLAVFLVTGCARAHQDTPGTVTFSPVPQQNVMGNLAVNAGYEVAGIPFYTGIQWSMNVRVLGCTSDVTLYGNVAPEATSPSTFTVYKIGDALFADLNTGSGGKNLKADELRQMPGMKTRLGCG